MPDPMGVIFDMDGVLVDSYQAHFQSWRDTARRFGVELGEDDFARTFGKTSREIIRQLFPGRFSDEQVLAFDAAKEQAYRDILSEHFPEMEGASELIAALHTAGFALAIGSSGPQENVQLVRRLLPAGRFIDAIVHGGLVQRGKPDPDIFLLAARQLNLEPRRCAVIEDAPVGLQAARRAAMTPIALTGTADRATLAPLANLTVDSLRQLAPQQIASLIDLKVSR